MGNDIEIFYKDYSYDEIFSNLKDEKTEDFIKIFSIINLDKIYSIQDGKIFLKHLTNQPNPIREIVALKLEEIINKNLDKFTKEDLKEQLTNGLIDINPNVSRAIVNIINKNNSIKELLIDEIILKIEKTIKEIEIYEKENKDFFNNKIRNTKNHAKNKKLFSLYWLLEGLSECNLEKYNSQVLEILKYTINFLDYTIREKTAKILGKMPNTDKNLFKKIHEDENFYVKNQVYAKISFED